MDIKLSIEELNELVYCLGRVIAEDANSWNIELKKELYNKLYTELENKINDMEVYL